MTKRVRSIGDFMFCTYLSHICRFHVLYMFIYAYVFMFCTCSCFVYVYLIYVGFMFCTCSYMYMFSCFILDKIEHHLRGSFHLPPIFYFIAFMFCHHQKGGDCWPKGYNPWVMCFDDNKSYKSYLVLIEVKE